MDCRFHWLRGVLGGAAVFYLGVVAEHHRVNAQAVHECTDEAMTLPI
nr:hypothetical protein [Serratia sp. JUb9]